MLWEEGNIISLEWASFVGGNIGWVNVRTSIHRGMQYQMSPDQVTDQDRPRHRQAAEVRRKPEGPPQPGYPPGAGLAILMRSSWMKSGGSMPFAASAPCKSLAKPGSAW